MNLDKYIDVERRLPPRVMSRDFSLILLLSLSEMASQACHQKLISGWQGVCRAAGHRQGI